MVINHYIRKESLRNKDRKIDLNFTAFFVKQLFHSRLLGMRRLQTTRPYGSRWLSFRIQRALMEKWFKIP